MVFIPEVYKEGIESILVQTIKYKAWNLQTLDVNLDDAVDKDNAEFDKQSTGNTTLTPMFAASYHLNPSNVSADSLSPEKMSFLAKDVNILTKAPGLMPTITGRIVENGILTVSANLSGDIKDLQSRFLYWHYRLKMAVLPLHPIMLHWQKRLRRIWYCL